MKDSEKFVITHGAALDNAVQVMHQMLVDNGWLKVHVVAGNRSLSQNALYWLWMAQISAFVNDKKGTDFNTQEMHEWMKHTFLGYDEAKVIGKAEIPAQLKSTAKLSKNEMFHYMEKIDHYWAQLGCLLVTPDDSIYAEMRAKHEGR
jgi:hypothetical protein